MEISNVCVHQGPQKTIHRLFEIGLIGKLVDGGLEMVGGVLLFFVGSTKLTQWVQVLTQHELTEDPEDIVVLTGLLEDNRALLDALRITSTRIFDTGSNINYL